MRRIFRRLLFLFFFIVPFEVQASAFDIQLSCPQTAYLEEVVSCKITYSNDLTLNALIVKYSFPEVIEYQELVLNTNWNSYYSGNIGFVLGSNALENYNIATLKLKISSNARVGQKYQIGLQEIDASDTSFNSLSMEDVFQTIQILEEEVTSSDSTETETSESKQGGSSQVVTSNIVTNENDTQISEIELSNDSKLKSITLSYGDISFDPDAFEYRLTVPYSISSIQVEAIAHSSLAVVTVDNPDELVVGVNKIVILVEAEDQSISKYIIVVNREEEFMVGENGSGDLALSNFTCLVYCIGFIVLILISMVVHKWLKRRRGQLQV